MVITHRVGLSAHYKNDRNIKKGQNSNGNGIKESHRGLKVVFADSVCAYKRSELPDWAGKKGFLLQPVLRPAKAKGFIVLPKRWIVERTHAWAWRSRRHSKDYKHQTKSSETMILIALIKIMLKY